MRKFTAAALLPLGIWGYLASSHGRWWSTAIRLPRSPEPETWPSVTVVMPARDEAEVLPKTLPALLSQDYPGEAKVVLVDDRSTDGTSDIAQTLAMSADARLPLEVIKGDPRPDGWAGKPWALEQGVSSVDTEWLLMTDADIVHPQDSLRRLVAAAVDDKRQMVSLMARLNVESRWEKLLIPAFVYFFMQLYPFSRVNRRGARTAAAAGGCILISSQALQRAGGMAAIAEDTIDDVNLARVVKRSGSHIWLGLADEVTSVRRLPSLKSIWSMVSRTAYTELDHSPLKLAGAAAGLGIVYFVPPIAAGLGIAKRRLSLAAIGAAAWAIMTATYVPTARYYKVSPATSAALPFIAGLYTAMTFDSARQHHFHDGVSWKGRTY